MDSESHEEQELRNEVIYLHYLWHQGPPSIANPPTGSTSPNVPFTYNDPQSSVWQPCHLNPPAVAMPTCRNPSVIARNRQYGSNFHERKRKDRGEVDSRSQSEAEKFRDSGLEWPCPEPSEEQSASKPGWPSMEPRASKVSRTMSDEERSRLMALEVQYRAFDSCSEFFGKRVNSTSASESDGALSVEEDEADGDTDDDVSEDCEEYKFLFNIFVEDCELRNYYEKNYEQGEFFCLVCGRTGKKNGKKRFRDCIGLVQHSLNISKTLKRRAHRAFGKVICMVIGWDVDRIPVIVVKGKTLGQLLEMKQLKAEGKHKENADDGKDNVEIPGVSVNHYSESCQETNSQVILCKDSTGGVDGSHNTTENNDRRIPSIGADDENAKDKDALKKDHPENDNENGGVNDKVSMVEVGSKRREGDPKAILDVLTECVVSMNDIGEAVGQGTSDVNQTSDKLMPSKDFVEEHHTKINTENAGVKNEISVVEGSHQSPDIEIKWPYEMSSVNVSSTIGWPASKPHFPKCVFSAEEQASVAALQLQQKVIGACKKFFAGNRSSGIDDDDDATEFSEDEEEMDDIDFEACEEFKFLLKLFTEGEEIRRYYENHSKEGSFYCLVCGSIGKKAWKTFKGCIGLLQHANAIVKTEKKRAHRAYVQIICKILGWDVERLPAIVLKCENLGKSLANSPTENSESSQ